MPYKSDAQRKFFHTNTAKKKGVSAAVVKEFDKASKGMKLPDHASKAIRSQLRKRMGSR